MSNTLTGLVPTIYKALNTVAREMVGMIPAVQRNAADMAGVAVAAKDQTVRVPIAPVSSLEAITPGATPADSGDSTMSYVDITMDQFYAYPIRWEGEEKLSVGSQYEPILQQQFEQGFRTFANAIETDLAELYKYGSRAYGTAGTTPFGSSLQDAAEMKRILDDNGCPPTERSLVVNTAAGANMRTLSNLSANYAAGTDQTLRQGTLLPLFNFDIKESAQIQSHTAGTAALATSDATGYAIGSTSIALASAGTGTLLTGDVITFAGDTNKYILTTGDTDVSDGGTIVLGAPGTRVTMSAATKAITRTASYTANMAFHRNAIVLASRRPEGGDAAVDEMIVTDPFTGISFRLAVYPQYMRNKMELQLLWGVKVIKPEFVAVLIG